MLTASEFHMKEPIPLSRVHEVIFEFCRGREVIIFGAQAVNAHVDEPRMTQNVDIFSSSPKELADELAHHLHDVLHIALRVREVKPGVGYRVYQSRKEGARHLADVRLADVDIGEPTVRDGIRYSSPAATLAMKMCALHKRKFAPKGATDLADARRLLLAHPELRVERGAVSEAIVRMGEPNALDAWRNLLAEPVVSDEDVDEGY
jgi:hypothetical protein